MLEVIGKSKHPCLILTMVLNQSLMPNVCKGVIINE